MKTMMTGLAHAGVFLAIFFLMHPVQALDVNLTGTVYDINDLPVAGASVALKYNPIISTQTDVDGKYSLTGQLSVLSGNVPKDGPCRFIIRKDMLYLHVPGTMRHGSVSVYDAAGRMIQKGMIDPQAQDDLRFRLSLPQAASVFFVAVEMNGEKRILKGLCTGDGKGGISWITGIDTKSHMAKITSISAVVDSIIVSKQGFDNAAGAIDSFAGIHDFILVHTPVFLTTLVPLSFRTTINASHTTVPRYGILPNIAVASNSDNSYDIAVYMSQSLQARIFSFDASGAKTGEFSPAGIAAAKGLLGFAKISDDNSFVLGWSKDNASGSAAFEYWISRFDKAGSDIFSTRIFGDKHIDTLWAKGQPGSASSGRIAYNPLTKMIGFYCGHTMKWDDGVRHQGGYMGFMDLQGKDTAANDWFFSHNFDQRLVVADSFYYALAHGDAYPRALGFSKWTDRPPRGRKLVDVQYFAIPGTIGDNTTNTQTGGLVRLADNSFGVVFSTLVGRASYDVRYKRISAAGASLDSAWLTAYPSGTLAIYPRIAPYGRQVIVMWEEVTGNAVALQCLVVGTSGAALNARRPVAGMRLSPFYDVVPLNSGDALWATLKAQDTLAVCRVTP